MPMEGFVKHVDDSSASLLLNNPEVAPWERRAGRVGLGFSSDADEVMHTNRARRSRSRSRTRDRGRDHQRARRSRSRSRDRQRDHRNRRSRSRERHGRRRSRPRSRSRNRRSSRSRSRSGNRRDRDHDRHGQSRVPHDEGRTRDVRDVRPSGSSRHEAPAPVSGAALSIAQKLKARAEANGKERGAGSWATQQATQLALRDTIHRDDNQRGGGWEQFDLNKMNYELETKGAMVSDQRKAVLAAIDGESECIRDEIDEDQYRHSSTGVSSQDDRHMAKIFGHVSTAGSGFGYGQQRKSADSRGADANKECLPDASGLDLDGATVEGFTEDGSAQHSGGGAGVSGWKDRIKRAQMAQKVASDRLTTLRMQRIAAAQKLSDGSRMPSTAGV